jgi:glutamate--cysteine ligase
MAQDDDKATAQRRALPRDEQQLRELLKAALLHRAHPDKERLLGLEYEVLRARRDDCSAAPSRGPDGPDDIVLHLAEGLAAGEVDVEPVRENGVLTVVHVGSKNLSLEPGGQLEISFAPRARIKPLLEAFDRYVPMFEKRLEGTPYKALYLGHQPITMPDDIPLRDKPRYAVMDRRLRRVEELGPHMMRATAGQQLTLDFRDEREAVRMLRASCTFAPFMTAIFANSPFVGGQDSGFVSYREHAWLHTDPSRCGMPAELLREEDTLDGYIDFALEAEAWFRHGESEIEEIPEGSSWREVWAGGQELSLRDWDLHCSTLFPVSRFRGGIEVRSADCTPPELIPAFLALIVGALYDEEARDACLELHPYRTQDDIDLLHAAVSVSGPRAVLDDGFDVHATCTRFVDIAREGLRRLEAKHEIDAGASGLLAPIAAMLSEASCPAEEAIKRLQSCGSYDGIAGARED